MLVVVDGLDRQAQCAPRPSARVGNDIGGLPISLKVGGYGPSLVDQPSWRVPEALGFHHLKLEPAQLLLTLRHGFKSFSFPSATIDRSHALLQGSVP